MVGRGFIGDLFNSAGYHLVLIDASQSLIDELNYQGKYNVFRASGEQVEKVEITAFTALHISQIKEIQEAFDNCDLMAVSVYP
jgi:mannitol-1-phosphate 5-dehydrogenase